MNKAELKKRVIKGFKELMKTATKSDLNESIAYLNACRKNSYFSKRVKK